MSYLTQDKIASASSMLHRVAQCYAGEQDTVAVPVTDPDRWAYEHRRYWADAPGWDDAWTYAENTHPDDPDYDPGADEAVITDAQILSQIQSMLS